MTPPAQSAAAGLPTQPMTELPDSAELVVVGGGLMGSMTAWAANRRGLGVLLLEQFDIGHDRGSSHGSARIVRRAYPDPLYARLTGQAFQGWRELERDAAVALLRITGGLDHGEHRDVPAIARTLSELGIAHELLDPAAAVRRWPGMVFTTDVLYHPHAGTVDAAAAVRAAVSRAAARGAVVATGTRVTAVRSAPDGSAVVSTDRGEVRAARVAVAAGAWAESLLCPLLRDADVAIPPLQVTQQQVFHFARQPDVPEWPVTVHEATLSTYGLPGGRDGGPDGARKVAEHFAPVPAGAPTTAEHRSGLVDPEARRRIVEYVQRWLPGLDPRPFAESTCLYTTTPSEDFVLDRVGPVVVCSACSGHGAKFAPLIGEMVVDLIIGIGADGYPARAEPRFSLPPVARTGRLVSRLAV